jgi:hypothetical protein
MDLNNSPGYIEAVASSRKKTKENLRVEQVIPSEILEDSGETGIKLLLEKYYEFMNSHEFIYNEEETHSDLILDGLARFRIKDEKNENNQFYTDETGNLSTLLISSVDEFLPRASTFVGSSSIVDETLHTITLSQTQQEGMPIGALVEYFATGTPIGGLNHHGYYYIVYSYKNQIKLSSEPNGDPIGLSLSGVPVNSTHKLVGVNRSMEVDIDLRNITISNGNDLPGSLRASESDIGKTFTVNGLEAFNGLQAELTTPITNWVGPGPSYVLNSIEDAMDIDKNSDSEIDSTNQYLEMMQKEIAAAIPRSVSNVNVNKNTLYKRIVDFYKIRGSSDSVETFFRLLFNEPVEIVKPYDSTLIPSSSDYDQGTGLFATTRGFVSDKKIRLHDSYKYQKYSYLIKTGKNITDWDNVFNRLVHPAGFIFFGEILLLLENTRAALGDHKDSGAKDVTRESTFRDPANGFRRAQQQIRAYGTYNNINKDFPRFTLSSMPGIQPGVIGIEDIPLLVKAFGSVYGPKPEAFRFANASLSANIDSNGTITGIEIVQKGSGYTIPPSTTLTPSSLTASNITTVPDGTGATDNQFTTSTNHGFVTGDRVNVAKSGPFNDLDVSVTYYVRRIDDDTFTLHIVLEDAEAGTAEVELNSVNVSAATTASTVLTFTKENLAEITIFDAAATTPATNVLAVINSNGEIESVSVGNGGAGYQNPVVTVDAPIYSNNPAETQLSHINIPYLYGKTFRQRPGVYIEPPQAKDENDVPLTTNIQATGEITLQPTGVDYVKIRNPGVGFNNINRTFNLRNKPDNSTHFLDQDVRTGEQITLRIETSYIVAFGQENEPEYSYKQNAEASFIVENSSSATTAVAVVTISFANSTVGDDWLVKIRQIDGGPMLTIQGNVTATGTGEAANAPRLQFSNPHVTYTADSVFQTDFTDENITTELVDNGSFDSFGSNLVVNGDFATNTDWTYDSATTIENGTATVLASTNNNKFISQDISNMTSGKSYAITFNCTNEVGTGLAYVRFGGVDLAAVGTFGTGTQTYYVAYEGGLTQLKFMTYAQTGAGFTIDDVEVKELNNWETNQTTEPLRVINGKLRVTEDGTADANVARAWQLVTGLTAGKYYRVHADIDPNNTISCSLNISTSVSTSNSIGHDTATNARRASLTFKATTSQVYVLLTVNSATTVGSYAEFDNVTFREFYAWDVYAPNNGETADHTIALVADPADSSNDVLRVQTNNGLDTNAGGNIGGASRRLKLYDPENIVQLQGNTIRVSFKAKKAASGGADTMRAAYSTNEHGNSQWQTFSNLPSTEWADCSFEYDIKDALPRNDDYVAFQGDGSNGIVYIDDVKIELKYDYPKGIVRTNTDGSLAGIKITNSGSGYTDVPTITPTDGSHAVLESFLVPSKIASINITNNGHGYILNPDVWIGSSMDIEKRVVDDTVKLILSLNHEEDGLNLLDSNSYFGRKGDSYYTTSKKFGFNQTISQFGDQNLDTNYINSINKLNINSYISKEDKPPE